jgi:endonuclease/exonuclease/phosphatase (EEP) superfamily protein YafD
MAKPPESKSCLSLIASLLLLAAIVLLALVAYLTSYYGWPIYLELLSHFQVQYWVMGVLLVGVLLLLRRWGVVLIGLFCTAALTVPVLSWYVPPARLLLQPEADLRLMVANLNTKNQSYGQVLELVRSQHPDVAIFMEVDRAWQQQLDSLRDRLPYSSADANPDAFGMLVYSNLPLENSRIEIFSTPSKISVVTRLTVQSQPVTLLATHPFPPVRPEIFHARNRQLDQVAQYLDGINTPTILAGDLNTTMWSPYYRRLEAITGLHNSRDGFGVLPTWPVAVPFQAIPPWLAFLVQIPIDHCLVSDGLVATNNYTVAATGSDHKALFVDLRVTP